MLATGLNDLSARRAAWRIAVPLTFALVALLVLGTPAGAIFGNTSTISTDGVKASSPHIATDSQNNALIVWSEGEDGAHRVQAAYRPAGGIAAPIGLISEPGGDAIEPSVVFDEHDNALVVWTRYEGPIDNAFGRVQAAFRPAGGSFGAAQTISGAEPGVDYFEPHVDIDESAAVVWTRAVGEELSIEASFRSKDGSFGAPQTISGPLGGYQPQVAVDERGNSLAVWTTADATAVHSAFRPRTGDWSAPAQISTAGHDPVSPRVAFDGRNNAIAVWSANDAAVQDDPNFIQAAVRPAGGSFAAGETISNESGTADDPQIAFDENDNALLGWTRHDGSTQRIETSFHPRDGDFGVPQVVSPAGEDAYEPRIAVDQSAGVVWSISLGEGPLRVQGAFRQKGGSFGGPQTLSERDGDDSFGPSVAMDQGGNVLVAWTRSELLNFPVVQFAFRPRTGSYGEPSGVSAGGVSGAFEVQVATDCWSNAIAVWTVDADVTDSTNPTWVEASFARAGGPFGPPQRLSDLSRSASEPRVAFESDGDAVVTWTGEDSSGTPRVHASFRPAGNGFLPAAILSPAGSEAFSPQVAAGRGSVVVWSRSAAANVIAEASVKPEDDSFLPAEPISPAGEDVNAPQVAVGKDGTAVATWYAGDADHVAAAVGQTSPAGFGPADTLSAPGRLASEPQVAVDDRGSAIAVWTAGGGFIQTAFRPRRGDFGAPQDLSEADAFEPQVVFDESGAAIVAWTRFVGDSGQIETATRPRSGAFGDVAVISETGETLSNFAPHIAADDSAAVVWTAFDALTDSLRVQSAFRPKDGSFGAVQTLNDRVFSGSEAQVAVDERGNAVAVWTLRGDFTLPPAASTIQAAFRPRA